MRRRVDALGDFLVSLAVVVWVVGGAYGAVQVLRYTYDLAGIWWVMFAVVLLPVAMAIMPFVALIHDHSFSLFLGTWDALMLGWILQMAGGMLADRPRTDPAREDFDEEAPLEGAVTLPPPTDSPRASASATSDEGAAD
jgi:hypothetical protein